MHDLNNKSHTSINHKANVPHSFSNSRIRSTAITQLSSCQDRLPFSICAFGDKTFWLFVKLLGMHIDRWHHSPMANKRVIIKGWTAKGQHRPLYQLVQQKHLGAESLSLVSSTLWNDLNLEPNNFNHCHTSWSFNFFIRNNRRNKVFRNSELDEYLVHSLLPLLWSLDLQHAR